ncbi:branched-chain amino acid ABC transporter permease [Pigmentiphaga sp. NML080357]|uniref:branched-chain amino acid ABC transporter permease n=1 Tax=Pigmentiphaga sp. NML080357 TaxID=2008675 RepID=UPI000B40C24A|nr:branched-chain amino acid ABC transporter permease [Pigmentiphaga sp. NML080357]OVZ57964.1 branched-chain amino acid ABC transporter permease [Pigmentiphaga sp. NML080357]
MKASSLIAWIVALAVLALLPVLPEPIGTPFHVELGTKVLIMAIFAVSLQLLVGYTGLVSLGHAAYFGAAAYAVAMLTPRYEAGNGWLLLLAAIGCAALLALLIGFLVMRTRGIYFIMVTLAFGQLVYFVFHDVEAFGGSDGTYIYNKPAFAVAGRGLVDLDQSSQFYWFTLAGLVLTLAVLGLVLRSRLGHALVGIKHNEPRMRAAGYNTFAYKLASFVIGGALAGLAGFLYATQHGYVNPELVSWHQSGNALLMIILGGLGSLAGAVVGAFAFVLLAEWFQDLTKHWQLLMGGFIILAVAWMPQGLAGGFARLRMPHRGRPRPLATPATAAPADTSPNPSPATEQTT